MNQVVARQQVDAVVIPRLLLSQTVASPDIHIRTHHQIALAIVLATDISITRSPFDTGMLGIAEDRVAIQQIVISKAITTEGIGGPSPPAIVHMTIEITVVALLQITLLGHRGLREKEEQSRQKC